MTELLEFRDGCNGPYAECDYNLLLESLKPLVPDDWTFAMLSADIMSCNLSDVLLAGTPGMEAVGHEVECCGVLIWIDSEAGTVEPEQVCISKAGQTFGYSETISEPDKFMITSEEIYRRASLIRAASLESERD